MKEIDLPKDIVGSSAIHWACKSRNYEIIKTIVDKGCDINRLDEKGNSFIFYLSDMNEKDLIKTLELLVSRGFDINQPPDRNTVLGSFLINFIRPPYETIKWLISHGANLDAPLYSKLFNTRTIREYMLNFYTGNTIMEGIIKEYVKPDYKSPC